MKYVALLIIAGMPALALVLLILRLTGAAHVPWWGIALPLVPTLVLLAFGLYTLCNFKM